MKTLIRTLILIIGVMAALWVMWGDQMLMQGGGSGSQSGSAASSVKVSTAVAVREDVPVSVSLAGNVVAYETVAIKSRIDSQIVAVEFKDGDAVKEAQVLFRLDDRALKAQIRQLQADVQKEKAQLENTRLQYERAQELVKNNFVSQAQLDTAQATYRSQQAVLNAIKASLENSRVELSYCTITAPISGRAGTIHVTMGNNVKANDTTALVTINRVSPIRAQFAIPERYYEQVRRAMTAKEPVQVRAVRKGDAEETLGTLEYINNSIDTATGAFLARALFQNEKEALWPGMYVNVSVELGIERDALTVPAVAVQGDAAQHFVFRVKEGAAVKTPVTIARSVGEKTVVSGGLEPGDRVITDGLLRVTDGTPVEAANR